jgi:hypothetical protein
VFEPTLKFIAPEAAPEAVVVPFTVIVELAPWVAVGVSVILVTLFITFAVYALVPDANAGVSVPALTVIAESDESGKGARVTVMVYV